MSSKREIFQAKLLNCSADLQRSAMSFYLNPQGQTHRVFLSHALGILRGLNTTKARKFLTRLKRVGKEMNFSADDAQVKRVADDILTLGLLLKPV